ncbi:hypothetical protein HG531_005013 [Fusarium graminearum]|nr:hypothetical protein HG531_005013 [Fusarium graminearum]
MGASTLNSEDLRAATFLESDTIESWIGFELEVSECFGRKAFESSLGALNVTRIVKGRRGIKYVAEEALNGKFSCQLLGIHEELQIYTIKFRQDLEDRSPSLSLFTSGIEETGDMDARSFWVADLNSAVCCIPSVVKGASYRRGGLKYALRKVGYGRERRNRGELCSRNGIGESICEAELFNRSINRKDPTALFKLQK